MSNIDLGSRPQRTIDLDTAAFDSIVAQIAFWSEFFSKLLGPSTRVRRQRACPNPPFESCLPIRGTTVPGRPEGLHEIKHDGYRLIVQRDGKPLRLWTRNGHDWTARFPLIVEAALRNRTAAFVIDGGRCSSASTAVPI